LYLLLRLHGKKVTLEEVTKAVPVGQKGTSLLELKEAAARLGMQTEITRCSWEELVRCPKPALAYIKPLATQAGAGHFVVVLNADSEQNVDFIDGTDGVLYHNRHGFFIQGWTSHLLIPAPHSEFGWGVILTLAFWVSLGFIIWSFRRSNFMARLFRQTSSHGLLLVLGQLLMSHPMEAVGVQPSNPGPRSDANGTINWRTSENDGVTCLYVLLALEGRKVNYVDLLQQISKEGADHRGGSGMVGLCQVAKHNGLNLDIRKCGVKDLTADHLPLIAFMEQEREAGSFVLVVWLAGDRCGIVDGYGRYNQVSVDDFRRRFSGYVLVRQTSPRWWLVFTGIGCWVVLLVYGWLRIRPTWRL
jgi:ABC-type bacteriocin/lantibiotic exporter with double-glycine peptidase domain